MAFTLIRDGKRTQVHLEGPRTLAEILNQKEYDLLESGQLFAMTEGGGLMELSSPLDRGQVVILERPGGSQPGGWVVSVEPDGQMRWEQTAKQATDQGKCHE